MDWGGILGYGERLLKLGECYVNLGGSENEKVGRECLKEVRLG